MFPRRAATSDGPLSAGKIPVPGDYQDALEAVLEGLDIPYAATVGDEETRTAILLERVLHIVIFLRGILDPDRGTYRRVEDEVVYLRAHLAEHPATGYTTWDERVAGLEAAKAVGVEL